MSKRLVNDTNAKLSPESTKSDKKLYVQELQCCTGSLIQDWVWSHFSQSREALQSIQAEAYRSHTDVSIEPLKDRLRLKEYAINALLQGNIIFDQAPVAVMVPSDTLKTTLLHDPVMRLIDQIKDWQDLSDEAVSQLADDTMRKFIQDARSLPLEHFLQKWAFDSPTGRRALNNHMVRALAENRIGQLAVSTPDAALLLPVALDVLHYDFDIIGSTEHEMNWRSDLCSAMGWEAPRGPLIREVVNRDSLLQRFAPSDAAMDLLEQLTRYDQHLTKNLNREHWSRLS